MPTIILILADSLMKTIFFVYTYIKHSKLLTGS